MARAKEKKKKRSVDEDSAPVKKKRSPEQRAKSKLAKRKASLNEALGELDLEKLGSVNPGEREYLDEYVWMFNKIGRLIRATEQRALTSGQSRDIYALSTLISQQREIIADIRTLSDLSGHMQMIREAVLQPMSSELGQNTLDMYFQLRTLIRETSDKKQTQFALSKLDEVVKEHSKFIQLKYNEASTKLDGVLNGDISAAGSGEDKPKRKKKRKAAGG